MMTPHDVAGNALYEQTAKDYAKEMGMPDEEYAKRPTWDSMPEYSRQQWRDAVDPIIVALKEEGHLRG